MAQTRRDGGVTRALASAGTGATGVGTDACVAVVVAAAEG